MNAYRPGYNYSRLSPQQPYQPKKRSHFFRRSFLVIVAFILVGLAFHFMVNDKASAKASSSIKTQTELSLQASIGGKINKIISQNQSVTSSVSLIDLDTGKAQNFGTQDPMEAASTAKLITATNFLHDVENGSESLSEQIGGYSARYELEQMVNQSDDTAWANLNAELGNDQLQNYANSIGLSTYDVYTNQISASDIAKLLDQLYKGKLLNQADTNLLLSYMQNTNYEDFIPPAIPTGDQIYHKVGELDDYVHDAAIITNGHQSFVLVIFTNGNGTYNWPARAALMQQITKLALPAYLD